MRPRVHELFAVAVALLLAGLHASSHAAADKQPLQLIRATTQQLLTTLDQRPELRTEPGELQRLAERYIAPQFDFMILSRLALGKHWRRATDEQKTRFTREFRRLLVRTYSVSLTEYSNQQIDYQSRKTPDDERRAAVRMRIASPGKPTITVDYRLLQRAEGWKIYDVSIEGISLAANYRTSFSEEIRRNGLDGLIAHLVSRNADQCVAVQLTATEGSQLDQC